MSDDATSFVGSIPQFYDQGLGPIIFADYAADIARRVAAGDPARVLETAAGTGIVTRKLRDALPADARPDGDRSQSADARDRPRQVSAPASSIELQPADAVALPFADASFDAVVCQFG